MLGDTLQPSVSALGELLKKGRVAAEKWKKADRAAEIHKLEEAFRAARLATRIDEWQVNAVVPYNEWANLTKPDFAPVVAAYRALLAYFRCDDCSGSLRVSPERGPRKEGAAL